MKEQRQLVFVGIRNMVVALDSRDGSEVWRTKIGGMALVIVQWDGEALYASAKGEVSRLSPRDGAVLWNNKLKGLGTGSVTIATTRHPSDTSAQVVVNTEYQNQKSRAAATSASA